MRGTDFDSHPPRSFSWRPLIIAVLIIGCLLLHVLTSPHAHRLHDFYFKITYVQIILAALWYGKRGGLLVSVMTSLIYIGHIEFQLAEHGHHSRTTLFLEIALYNVLAFLVGALSDRQRAAHRRLRDARQQLERSYSKLQEQAATLLTAEQELRESRRLRVAGQLAAEFAHEVRNPLGGILGAAEILSRPGVDEARREEFAAVLTRETRRLDGVVSSFLDLTRRRGPHVEGVALATSVRSVQSLLEPQVRAKRIEVEFDDRTDRALLDISAEHLSQALINLLLNAIEALPAGGRIRIIATCPEDVVRIRVEDDGPGVPETLRPRLFEPFVSGASEGSGLGLAIVRRLLEEAGGAIELIEDGAPTGAAFLLTVPAQEIDGGTRRPAGRTES